MKSKIILSILLFICATFSFAQENSNTTTEVVKTAEEIKMEKEVMQAKLEMEKETLAMQKKLEKEQKAAEDKLEKEKRKLEKEQKK